MKKLLLLLLLCSLSIGISAEGEYPNVLVIQRVDGTERIFTLEKSTLSIYPNSESIYVTSEGQDVYFPLSEVKGIKYEYYGLSGIKDVVFSDTVSVFIYSMDGRIISSSKQSLQESLGQLSHGVYIIKMNGKTLKIAK